MAATSGSQEGCNIACRYTAVSTCVAGDGCCPDGCDSKTDTDCSTTCGNNTVDANESCDGTGDKKCAASCDDNDPCTEDHTSGSAKNCSLRCTHVPVTQARAGDGCCPPGASANTDSDCQATCGNMKVEQGEDCDDGNQATGDGCTPACKAESPVEQCIAELGDKRMPECARCNCEKCQDLVHACYGSDNADANKLCTGLVECGLDKKCSSQSCYCGTAPLTTCILGVGDGPCKGEVERAGGSSLPGDLLTRSNDASYPLGRANALAACARESCMAECGLGAN
jgi:cysteine-rich repeat protein